MRARGSTHPHDLPERERRKLALTSLLRSLLTGAVIVVAYFTLPMTLPHNTAAAVRLTLGLLVVALVLAWQLHEIRRSPYPAARAVGALATSVPLFFVVFATTYFLMERTDPQSMSEPLSRLDSAYFTVTVFATVGFGDITPVSEPARLVALVQMLGDLVIVGFVARAFINAVQQGAARLNRPPERHDG